jgi:hypothetical protein
MVITVKPCRRVDTPEADLCSTGETARKRRGQKKVKTQKAILETRSLARWTTTHLLQSGGKPRSGKVTSQVAASFRRASEIYLPAAVASSRATMRLDLPASGSEYR